MEIDGCNAIGGDELSETIPILRTKFSTLEKTECYFLSSWYASQLLLYGGI